jgi:hypothetical protein
MPTTDILNHSLETLQPTVAIPTPAAPSFLAATASPVCYHQNLTESEVGHD